jgi:general secretion pathway protein G
VIGRIEEAKVNTAKAQISTLQSAVKYYKIDTGQYPTSLEDLVVEPAGVVGWNQDGYLDGAVEIPLDPWGYEYEYEYHGQRGKFEIYSYGADGEAGGEDADADIYSSELYSSGSAD